MRYYRHFANLLINQCHLALAINPQYQRILINMTLVNIVLNYTGHIARTFEGLKTHASYTIVVSEFRE